MDVVKWHWIGNMLQVIFSTPHCHYYITLFLLNCLTTSAGLMVSRNIAGNKGFLVDYAGLLLVISDVVMLVLVLVLVCTVNSCHALDCFVDAQGCFFSQQVLVLVQDWFWLKAVGTK